MAYLNESFNLELVLTADSGKTSGIALLFLFTIVIATCLHGFVCKSLYRQMALVSLKSWLECYKTTGAFWSHAAMLHVMLDLVLLGCCALLVITAALSGSPTSACTVFFVGGIYASIFMVLFSLYGNGFFQPINSAAYAYGYSALLFYGVFVLVQLLAVGGGVKYSYRALGALWIGLSLLPFFFIDALKEDSVGGDLFPAAKCNFSCLALKSNRHVRKFMGVLQARTRWLISLVPVLVFAVYSAKRSTGSSEASVYVLITVVVVEAFFQLTGNKIEDHLEHVVISRFVLVLVGQQFWLVGVVWAALCVAWLNLKVCINCALQPAVASLHLGDLIHKALDEAATESNAVTITSPITAANGGDEKDTVGDEPVYAKIIAAFLQDNPSISLLGMQVFVAIAMAVASRSPSSLAVDPVDGMSQVAWAGCFWLIWAASSMNYLCYFTVVRNGLGRVNIVPSFSSYWGMPTGDTTDEQQGGADLSCISTTLAAVADCVKEGMDDRPSVGALCIMSWATTVGATVLAAYISSMWVVVPLIALLPPSAKIFYNFLRGWEDAGCPAGDVSMVLRPQQPLHKSWQPALVLFVLSIGLACIPSNTTFLTPIYLGLWILAFALNAVNIVYWRCSMKADCVLVALLLVSWGPTVVWSIVFGVRSRTLGASKHSPELVVMLLFACTAAQLLFLSSVVWRDCSKNGVGAVANEDLQPRTFLKFLLAAALSILFVLCSIFSATISTPLGVALLVLLLAAAFMTAQKVDLIETSDACCVVCLSKCCYTDYRKTVAVGAVFCVVVSGVVGSVSYPSHAFWWASFSWLAIAFAALTYGIWDHISSPPKSHGRLFYPVYSFDAASNTVRNVSLQSSSILLFFLMLSLYSIWCSIIVLPFESGLVMFLVTNAALALYVRLVCGGSLSTARNAIDEEILAAAKSEGLVRIYLQPECEEEEKDPSCIGELGGAKQDVELRLAGKVQELRKAEEHFNSLLARHSAAFLELSPWPFVYVFSHLCGQPAMSVQDNPIVESSSAAAGGAGASDVESQAQGGEIDLVTAAAQLQAAHDALLSQAVDFSRWRAFTLLKASIQADEAAQRRTSELLAFLRSTAANDERLSAEQRKDLQALTADQFLRHFSPQALATLLDAFRAYQLAEEARRKEAERRRLEKEKEELAAKRELLRRADEERQRARETAERERLARQLVEMQEARERAERFQKEAETAAQAAEELRKKVLIEAEASKRAMEDRHARELEEERRKAKEEADRAAKARVSAEQEAAERERKRLAAIQLREQEQRRKQEELIAAEARRKREEEAEAARRAAEKLRQEQLEAERKLAEAQRRAEAVARMRVPMEVVGRYGISLGTFSDVVGGLGISASSDTRFDDEDFDFGQKADILGGELASKSGNVKVIRLTEKYKDQIDQWQKKQQYEHGCVTLIDARNVNQGQAGDCYFMSAIGALAEKPARVRRLFPLLGDGGGQRGWKELQQLCASRSMFAVRIHFDGAFRIVLLDDRVFSTGGNPYFASGLPGKEVESIWVMLLEKAYAKLHGTFAAIEGGFEHYSMEDLTGGVPSLLTSLQSDSQAKWEKLKLMYEGGHLLGASSHSDHDDTHISPEGVVYNHAYTILEVREVDDFKLLRMKNPWGGAGMEAGGYRSEWRGEWSDKSKIWTARYKRLLKFSDVDDGIFWLNYTDFIRVFERVYICRVFAIEGDGAEEGNAATTCDADRFLLRCLPRDPTSFPEDEAFCSWMKNTAGGCTNHGTFGNNPQFVLSTSFECNVTVVLSQSESIEEKRMSADAWKEIKNARNGHFKAAIGLSAWDCRGARVAGQGAGVTRIADATFQYERDSTLDFKISPNRPVTLVATMFKPASENTFTLRAFAQLPKRTTGGQVVFDLLPLP